MRILQYNILNGCRKDPDRLARLRSWLKAQAYHVAGFNELNGWHKPLGMRSRWPTQIKLALRKPFARTMADTDVP